MYKLFVPSPDSHWRRTLATISGPLSDRMKTGAVQTVTPAIDRLADAA
jgi:hypothetical protein